MKPGWLMTFTGRIIYPLEMKVDDITIADIAHHSAYQCRYAGAVKKHYSVAEHSVHISRYAIAEDQQEALLHDAGEAYVQDLLMGLKHSGLMEAYRTLEKSIEALINERFGIKSTPESRARIKALDTRIVMDETQDLMHDCTPFWEARKGLEPLGIKVLALKNEDAELFFLRRFARLFPRWNE